MPYPVTIDMMDPDEQIQQLCAGYWTSAILTSKKRIILFGGIGSFEEPYVISNKQFTHVTCAFDFWYAANDANEVFVISEGTNNRFQSYSNSSVKVLKLESSKPMQKVKFLQAGMFHAIVVTESNQVLSVGYNYAGAKCNYIHC